MLPLLARTFLSAILSAVLLHPACAAEPKENANAVSASVLISATTPNLVRISDLDDVALGTWSGSGDLVGGDDSICIWSSSRAYRISAVGSGPNGAFQLRDTNATPLNYTVEWNSDPSASAGFPLVPGAHVGQQPATTTSMTCNENTESNASMLVRIAESDLAALPASTFTGTLTLVVSAE